MTPRPLPLPASVPYRARQARSNSLVPAALAILAILAALSASGCAAVKPYEREKLSDPIMDPGSHLSKQTLEQKFFSTREGSAGGGAGVGGGCGCAK